MKIKFNCDSGANIHSCRTEIIDLQEKFGISDNEWENMDEGGRFELVRDWAEQKLAIYYEEIK